MRWQVCFLLVVFVWADDKEEIKDLSHGFGTDIEWIEWPKAMELSNELKKPVFLLIHKTWCGACKQLKKSFETSPRRDEFVKLSRKFVMVNLEDDEEPQDDKFAPDGGYIPRVLFLKGEEPLSVDNKKNYPKNAHYYPQLQDVIRGMNDALKAYGADESKDSESETTKEKPQEVKPKKTEEVKPKKKTDEKKKEKTEKVKPKKTDEKKIEKKEKPTDDKPKKETKKTTDDKKKEKPTDDKKKDEECPHAKKAKEEKAKKDKAKSDSTKSGKDNEKKAEEVKPKKTKESTKKSEL